MPRVFFLSWLVAQAWMLNRRSESPKRQKHHHNHKSDRHKHHSHKHHHHHKHSKKWVGERETERTHSSERERFDRNARQPGESKKRRILKWFSINIFLKVRAGNSLSLVPNECKQKMHARRDKKHHKRRDREVTPTPLPTQHTNLHVTSTFYIYMYIYIHKYIYVCTCIRIKIHTYTCLSIYINAYMNTRMHAHACIHMHAYMHTYLHTYKQTNKSIVGLGEERWKWAPRSLRLHCIWRIHK